MILVFSALLFSISSNLDNVVVGMAYGLKKIKIGLLPNLLIAIITSIGTFLSMSIGKYISVFLSKDVANILGSVIIIILGIYFVIASIPNLKRNNLSKSLAVKDVKDMAKYAEESDLDNSGDINIKEAILIAVGLTFNNLGTGVAASITGVNIEFTVVFTFALSILTILFGEYIGNHVLGRFFGKYTPLVSGILFILLGIIEILN
ncbi:manganese efflux pump [Clostridium felsineum]|uniref:Sporulation protein YtaF n=1 Tax=Clostridium felsineum TaxID=36839 RepID=A0A1S8LVF4_9CLOT|nr:manganese efflux pump [Clostridium felsineum]URZ04869.1 putative sporulation protein YtaF [Clostridium felsineum]URZ09910.1 putative sporulation protein YtaF [Clostridium felsineum]